MRIAIEAVALRSAGGRSVGVNFLSALRENSRVQVADAFVPANVGYETLGSARLQIHTVSRMFQRNWLRPLLDRHLLARRIAKQRPDVVFTMGNMALPTLLRQVVLFHWPYAIYPESIVWRRMSWKDRQARKLRLSSFRQRLQYADVVVTQTSVAAERLGRIFPGEYRTVVIPPAVSLIGRELVDVKKDYGFPPDRLKLLCLTRYYPHKNLEILLPLARLIAKQGLPFTIVTTVSPDQHPAAGRLLERISSERLHEVIYNIGPVRMEEVPGIYRATEGLLLPTLLESFSGTYAEAMYWKRPIFTSDRDFAREVCGNFAYYFEPLSPESILDALQQAFRDERLRGERIEAAYQRALGFPDWKEVTEQYLDLFADLGSGRPMGRYLERT